MKPSHRTTHRSPIVLAAAALAAFVVLVTCDSSNSRSPTEPDDEAVFLINSCPDAAGETFRALMRDPALIAEAERLIATGDRRILIGTLRAGNGGFNAPWSWHQDPATLEFADVAVEVCDGCASFVENDLDVWLNNVGFYCPWAAVFLQRER
jgi:hypothetical protein